MKKCPKCCLELDEIEFSKLRTGKFSSYCKKCSNSCAKEAYKNNSDKVKKSSEKSRKTLKTIVNGIKSKYGCSFCNEKEGICLDFHHLDKSKKDLDVSNFIKRKMKKEAFDEINKCIVVCSNCHRKIHANLLSVDGKVLCNEKYEDYFEQVGDRLLLRTELRKQLIKSRKNIYAVTCECGGLKTRTSLRCQACDNKVKLLISKCPSKEILEQDMKEFNNNFSAISRKYDVTSNTIKKWLIRNNLYEG